MFIITGGVRQNGNSLPPGVEARRAAALQPLDQRLRARIGGPKHLLLRHGPALSPPQPCSRRAGVPWRQGSLSPLGPEPGAGQAYGFAPPGEWMPGFEDAGQGARVHGSEDVGSHVGVCTAIDT
eukprot:1194306-Prorocentrum_minimum.AAC.2